MACAYTAYRKVNLNKTDYHLCWSRVSRIICTGRYLLGLSCKAMRLSLYIQHRVVTQVDGRLLKILAKVTLADVLH